MMNDELVRARTERSQPRPSAKVDEAEAEHVTLSDMARQEFWLVAKMFFAPVYGTALVLRHVLRTARLIDSAPQNRS